MKLRLFLLISILAVSAANLHAQGEKNVAIRWIVGETGSANNEGERPRLVAKPVEGVKSSVAVNIKTVEHIAFDMINRKRAEAGKKPLAWSDELEAIARFHSADMAELEYFSHRSPAGKMVSDRADDAHLGNWRAIGENIAFNRGFADPVQKAVDLWMNSPSHRANLLGDTWKEAGVGVAIADDGSYYFTQVFMTRK